MGWISRSRRSAATPALLCCMAAVWLAAGGASSFSGHAEAADTPPYKISSETIAQLRNASPGDRVHVVIQADMPDPKPKNITVGLITYCPSPMGTAVFDQTHPRGCASTPFGARSVLADPNGRIDFALPIPDDTNNSFPAQLPDRPDPFTCAAGNSCSIGFRFISQNANGTNTIIFDTTSLVFTPKDPAKALAACGAPQEGKFVSAAGPYRLTNSEIEWEGARCKGGGAQDLDLVAGSDVDGQNQFLDGQGDMFFGAGGVTADADQAEAAKRPAVPVPIALNAEVLAIVGQYPDQALNPLQQRMAMMDDLKLNADEIADLLLHPSSVFGGGPYTSDVLAANEQMQKLGGAGAPYIAYSADQPGHWILSRYLARHSVAWKYGDKDPITGVPYAHPNQPIGAIFDVSPLNPGNTGIQATSSSRISLGQSLNQNLSSPCFLGACLGFVLTDAETAAEFHLPVVQVRNAAGNYVKPTPESMLAAANDMTKLPDGSLVPDLSKNDPKAYPFTFVEHAYPAAQMGDACKAQLTRDLLSYIVDAKKGQAQLSIRADAESGTPGLVPLPAAMAAQATDALKKVAPQTGCGSKAAGGSGGGSGTGILDSSVLPDSGGPAGALGTAAPSSPGAAGKHPTRPVTASGQQKALQAANSTTIPLFAGLATLVLLVPLGALALTNGLTSGTAFSSAGRLLPPRVARVLSVTTAPLRRVGVWLARR